MDSGQRRPEEQHLTSRKIIINSAMINPKTNEKRGEWASLHNRGSRKTNIDNWKLVDGKGREAILKGTINSGESIRLKGAKKGKVLLSNSGGSLML